MKKTKLLLVTASLLLLFIFVACKNDTPQPTTYSSPTIAGKVNLPSGATSPTGEIWVKVGETGTVAKADSNGFFLIPNLENGKEYTLFFSTNQPNSTAVTRALGNHWGLKQEGVIPRLDIPEQVHSFILSPMGIIKGNVKLDNQSDNSGITVYIPGTSYQAKSDFNGDYTIFNVPQGQYTLAFETSGYSRQYLSDITLLGNGLEYPEYTARDIVLSKDTGRVIGYASLDEGTNHAGIEVKLEGVQSLSTSTSEDGSFCFENVTPGDYKLLLTYEGYSPATSGLFSVSAAQTTTIETRFELLRNRGTISGEVYSKGNPVSNVNIIFKNSTGDSSSTVSDKSGKFTKALKPGTYDIVVSAYGYESVEINSKIVTLYNNTEIERINLISILGSVEGKSFSPNERVSLLKGNTPIATLISGSDGSYLFKNIEAGNYIIEFAKDGYSPYRTQITVATGQLSTINGKELEPSYGYVRGKVFLSGSEVHSGIIVSLTSTKDNAKVYKDTTINDGSYSFDKIDKGEYLLNVSKEGYVTYPGKIISVNLGVVEEVDDIVLKNNQATVFGNIKLSGAATHEGIAILLINNTNDQRLSTTTDEKGNFLLNNVVPGKYELLVSKDGFKSIRTKLFDVLPSSEHLVDSQIMEVAIRSVTGTVKMEDKNGDSSGALITATNHDDTDLIYSAISNSDGRFTLAGMKAGEYTVVISANNYRTETITSVNVTEKPQDLGIIDLSIARGYIKGTVLLEGRDNHSGTTIKLVSSGDITTTDETGTFEFYVPAGNYPNGVIYTHEDFEPFSDTNTITVLTDSVYGINHSPTLQATAVPIIKGNLKVLGTEDYSGIKVSIVDTDFSMVTEKSGDYSFNHVPIGEYTLLFQREHTPDVTTKLSVVPSPEIVVDTITLVPDSAFIYGKVELEDMTSHSGVSVTVESKNGDRVERTTTDSAGYYQLGNILASVDHVITYSKDGWVSKQGEITNLERMEERELDIVTLVDIENPTLKSVMINEGANVAESNEVTVHLSVDDSGSGPYEMQVANSLEAFDYTIPKQPYSSSFSWELESGNGERTVYVKVFDRAGNESEILSASVTLVNQKKEVRGVLSGDDLHWIADQSPYLVTGNISVEAGDILTIDPGVDIQFAGDYYILIQGEIQAIGTKEKKINFYSLDKNKPWSGFRFRSNTNYEIKNNSVSYLNGNRFSYCDIKDAKTFAVGAGGSAFIENSEISSSAYIIENGSGYCFKNNQISGNCNPTSSEFVGNIIKGNLKISNSSTIYNNVIECSSLSIDYGYADFKNNKVISTDEVRLGCLVEGNTISSNIIELSYDYSGTRNLYTASQYKIHNRIEERFSMFLGDNYIVEYKYGGDSADFRNNYWGEKNTAELREGNNNLTFIKDYYDDFEKGKIIVSDFIDSPIPNVGYQGDAFFDFDVSVDISKLKTIEAGIFNGLGTKIENLKISSDNNIVSYRIGYSGEQLENAEWIEISQESYALNDSETNYDLNYIFIQVKDDKGNISFTKGLNIPLWEITFGSFESQPITWLYLEEKDGKYLLLSKDILCKKPYNEENADITWENCTLRKWLNGDFYNSSFTEDEKSKIQLSHIANPDNLEYGTDGGNDTEDYVFLLSIDEAEKYFDFDEDRDCEGDWYLRSPGSGRNYVANVDSDGSMDVGGDSVSSDYGIRPALWINL